MSNQLLLRRRTMASVKRPNYLKFTALEDGCTLALNKVGNPTDHPTEYSLNKGAFVPYVFGTTLTFNEGDTIEWRRAIGYESNSFSTNNYGYYTFATSGNIYQDGLVTTLLSRNENINAIGNGAFWKLIVSATGFVGYLTIQDGVVTLGDNCFNGCNGFNDVELGADVAYIGQAALFGFGAVNTLTIKKPDFQYTGAFNIYYPFYDWSLSDLYYNGTMLQFLQLQDNIYFSGQGKYNLHVIDRDDSNMNMLPEGITKIRNRAFYCVKNISGTVYFPNGIETIGSDSFAYSSISGIYNFPSSLVSIGEKAFTKIYISELNLPEGLKSIAKQAFYDSSCANIVFTFPSTLESIGDAVFYGTHYGKYSIFLSTTPPTIVNKFSVPGIVANKKVYVPYSADHSILNAYKTANVWSTFENLIFELDENGEIPT